MLPFIDQEALEGYLISLLEARVKTCMTLIELETPGTFERYLKLFYFERKVELYDKLIISGAGKNNGVNRNGWVRCIEALQENEELYAPFKKYWTFK